MRVFEGGVCYADMLGFGALTRGKISLTESDYASRNRRGDRPTPNSFAGRLLMSFRDVLREVQSGYTNISVAQLSDSAFLWSDDLEALANATRAMMWACSRRHLFCRAGMAYGEVVQPDATHVRLGHFVLGAAATHAVELERAGKGCRVFTEREFVQNLQTKAYYAVKPFQPLSNPLDGTIVDEFKWYLDTRDLAPTEDVDVVALAAAVAELWLSPLYEWNCATPEGRVHVAVALQSLSQALSDRTQQNFLVLAEHFLAAPTKRSHVAARNVAERWVAAAKRTA